MKFEETAYEIEQEVGLIEELITYHQLLFDKIKITSPDPIEISATATLLHSFYNGIENIFKRISKNLDKKSFSSSIWHQDLIQFMTKQTETHPPVISEKLFTKLLVYLGFRHFFRHAYAFHFKWEKIEPLIKNLKPVFNEFKDEINEFKEKLPKN